MKTDTGVDRADLTDAVAEAYGLKIARIRFVPKGEASHAYTVYRTGGDRYFLKLYRDGRMSAISAATIDFDTQAARYLHEELEIENIAYPIVTAGNNLYSRYRGNPIVLLNFIKGETVAPRALMESAAREVARTIATIHSGASALRTPGTPVEDFCLSFAADLRNGLSELSEPTLMHDPFTKRLVAMLAPHAEHLLTALRRTEYAGRGLAEHGTSDFVLCHADPHTDNLMVDRNGSIHLIDWNGSRFAPKELDLMFFLRNQWGAFSNAYASIAGPDEIRPEVWAFYATKRRLEDITDWLLRILNENTDVEQHNHDLLGLGGIWTDG